MFTGGALGTHLKRVHVRYRSDGLCVGLGAVSGGGIAAIVLRNVIEELIGDLQRNKRRVSIESGFKLKLQQRTVGSTQCQHKT